MYLTSLFYLVVSQPKAIKEYWHITLQNSNALPLATNKPEKLDITNPNIMTLTEAYYINELNWIVYSKAWDSQQLRLNMNGQRSMEGMFV